MRVYMCVHVCVDLAVAIRQEANQGAKHYRELSRESDTVGQEKRGNKRQRQKAFGVLTLQSQRLSGSIVSSMCLLRQAGKVSGMFTSIMGNKYSQHVQYFANQHLENKQVSMCLIYAVSQVRWIHFWVCTGQLQYVLYMTALCVLRPNTPIFNPVYAHTCLCECLISCCLLGWVAPSSCSFPSSSSFLALKFTVSVPIKKQRGVTAGLRVRG